jgi:hypothetical protein
MGLEGNGEACCHDPFVGDLARDCWNDYHGVAEPVEVNRRPAPRFTRRHMKIDLDRSAEFSEGGGRSPGLSASYTL